MADFTGKAIRASFLNLLEERAFKDITVRDIVNDCEISRSSFYYHFHDIPELLETIILEETEKIMGQHPDVRSIDECVSLIAEFTVNHKKMALHLYNSVRRDLFDQYLWRLADYGVRSYMKTLRSEYEMSDRDFEVIADYFASLVFGVATRWHMKGAPGDIRKDLDRILELRSGQIEEMLERCKQN